MRSTLDTKPVSKKKWKLIHHNQHSACKLHHPNNLQIFLASLSFILSSSASTISIH